MDARLAEEASITDLFDKFIEASTMRNVLSIYHRILNYSDLSPCEFNQFFPKLKRAVMTSRVRKNWKAKALFSKIDKKASHKCYSGNRAPTPLGTRASDKSHDSTAGAATTHDNPDDSLLGVSNRIHNNNNVLQNHNCLVIGSGPAGLRTAIELQLLGASRVVVVEKRSRFSRNNVLHLWPFVIDDLKSLGAKKFYGKFCAGSIDHISIRQLQLILLKICLMIGCDFRDSCSYIDLCPATVKPQASQANAPGVDENNSDINEANSSSDKNVFAVSGKCDLDEDKSISDNYVRVSDSLKSPTTNGGEHQLGSQRALNDFSEKSETSSESNSRESQTKSSALSETIPSNDVKSEASGDAHRRAEDLRGARAHFQCDHKAQERELHSINWDIIIGADGRRNTLSKFFPRKEFRGRLAIAVTANFINRQTPAEASVSEISGLSFIYNQEMFNSLAYDTGIELENICYYKDDTHYFVMTAKKRSLLERGVLIKDFAATQDLLSDSNVNRQALLNYARDAAFWTTGLDPLDFALNHYGQEDCAMFDFTSMYAASNACKALRTKGNGLALVGLVGDSLLEPFWPTGSGCARGFLSSFDAAWMCRQWAFNKCAIIDHHGSSASRSNRSRNSTASDSGAQNKVSGPSTYDRMALSVMAERESIYRILAQTTSENLQQNYSLWTLNPHSRYPNLNRHLVTPSQVEHLIADSQLRGRLTVSPIERSRKIKSPNGARKSPKKLKSANSSPQAQRKHPKIARSKLNPARARPRSQHDLALEDSYSRQLEASYADLDGGASGRRAGCDLYDDFFVPSVSGTMPSANNLLSLEARRARDIDDCLRQRRQRSQLRVVRDELISQFRGSSVDTDRRDGSRTAPVIQTAGGAALLGELKRLREQRAAMKENISVDRPLKLLSSIRRCASFAERVKSFESRMGSGQKAPAAGGQETGAPATPIDNVKNLPQFATLQELMVSSAKHDTENSSKQPKMPIMKLSKDDWNVKCWEKRLADFNRTQKGYRQISGSTKSLNKAVSVDSYTAPRNGKPEKQVEVFKDRIKEMAEKLTKDRNQKAGSVEPTERLAAPRTAAVSRMGAGRSQGWVSHLKQELIKGCEPKRPQQAARPAMNPAAPQKPIKKLFNDDDDDAEGGANADQHCDHLCINRPKNKYLSRNGYTSHLTRTRLNDPSSKLIELTRPTKESRQAYLNNLSSRGSSASSNLSDQSSATTGEGASSSTASEKLGQPESRVKCRRCNSLVGAANKITIGGSVLHLTCLGCTMCGITLRTNEIQHYLSQMDDPSAPADGSNFTCAICKPTVRGELAREAAGKLEGSSSGATAASANDFARNRMQSREQFLSQQINYNELYRNILEDGMREDSARQKIERLSSSNSGQSTTNGAASKDGPDGSSGKSRSSSLEYEDAKSSGGESPREQQQEQRQEQQEQRQKEVSPSPIMVTLPLELVRAPDGGLSTGNPAKSSYRIARSETIDGSEQVTLVLPSDDSPGCPPKQSPIRERADSKSSGRGEMIDEDELNRLLHLDGSSVGASERRKSANSKAGRAKGSPDGQDGAEEEDDDDDEDEEGDGEEHEESSDENDQLGAREGDEAEQAGDGSDELSSLNSEQDSENFDDADDDDDELDRNSTYEDFLTSEELGEHSDREDNLGPSGPIEQAASQCDSLA